MAGIGLFRVGSCTINYTTQPRLGVADAMRFRRQIGDTGRVRVLTLHSAATMATHGPHGPTFAAWLALQLRMRRLSHEQLARRSGVHRSTITRLASGERRPTLETARRLASALTGGRGESSAAATFFADDLGATIADPIARVERALRGDASLSEEGLRRVMRLYLQARRRD